MQKLTLGSRPDFDMFWLLEYWVHRNTALIKEGDMGVYGIAVLSSFSSVISVILILMCGIAVSSSPGVCGFSSLWPTVFGIKDPSRYCGTVHLAFSV